MVMFIESGIRGVLSQCYGKARNKYMRELYNPNEKDYMIMIFK